MKNLLFICSENKLRSPTAEKNFSQYADTEAISCGTNNDAETPLSGDLVEWADIIFVMENKHKSKLNKKFQKLLKQKHIICLGIPDNYSFMQPELIKILEHKVCSHLCRVTLR